MRKRIGINLVRDLSNLMDEIGRKSIKLLLMADIQYMQLVHFRLGLIQLRDKIKAQRREQLEAGVRSYYDYLLTGEYKV